MNVQFIHNIHLITTNGNGFEPHGRENKDFLRCIICLIIEHNNADIFKRLNVL